MSGHGVFGLGGDPLQELTCLLRTHVLSDLFSEVILMYLPVFNLSIALQLGRPRHWQWPKLRLEEMSDIFAALLLRPEAKQWCQQAREKRAQRDEHQEAPVEVTAQLESAVAALLGSTMAYLSHSWGSTPIG